MSETNQSYNWHAREPRRGSRSPKTKLRKRKLRRLYKLHAYQLSRKQRNQRERAYAVLAMMRDNHSFSYSCKELKISRKTVKKHVDGVIRKHGRRYKPAKEDALYRPMRTNENGRDVPLELASSSEATKLSNYHKAVRAFLQDEEGAIGKLRAYKGQGVTDSTGKFHPFETWPSAIRAIHERIEEPEEYDIYRWE